jgi:hypothetical protein
MPTGNEGFSGSETDAGEQRLEAGCPLGVERAIDSREDDVRDALVAGLFEPIAGDERLRTTEKRERSFLEPCIRCESLLSVHILCISCGRGVDRR